MGRAGEGRNPRGAGHSQYAVVWLRMQAERAARARISAQVAENFTLAAVSSWKGCKFCHPGSLGAIPGRAAGQLTLFHRGSSETIYSIDPRR